MPWTIIFLLILLAGGLGVTTIFRGISLWTKKGELGGGIAHIVGGVVLATPLGLVIWAYIYFSIHPFNIT